MLSWAHLTKSVYLTTTNVIIIFFKTMKSTFSAISASMVSKSAKTGSKGYNKSVKQYFQIDLTVEQARNIQGKLPKGFFLLDPSNEETQRFKNQFKMSYPQKDINSSKAQVIKKKKDQKILEAKQRIATQPVQKKIQIKEVVKQQEVQKQKINKREAKPKVFRKQSNKMQGGIQNNLDENYSSQQANNEQIISHKVVQADRKKEKQKITVKQTAKTKQPSLKMIQTEPIQRQYAKSAVNPFIQVDKQIVINQPYEPYSIPSLPNNMLRHDPKISEAEIQGTVEESTLRYQFGLPYSGLIQQPVPKLNQKQKNFCINIVQRLKVHRSSQAFRVPVDPLSQGVPDYYYVVYTPMDLKTIEKKLLKQKYRHISEFHADINMIFLNSYKYNLRETKYFEATIQFEDYYQQLLKQALKRPEQYSKQYLLKNSKPRNDDQEDYNENNSKKQRSKKQGSQYFRQPFGKNLSQSQIFEKEAKRKSTKLNRNRSLIEDQSGIYSQSIAMDTINDFENTQIQKRAKKQEGENLVKMKRVQSFKMSYEDIKPQPNISVKSLFQIQQQRYQRQAMQKPMQEQIRKPFQNIFNPTQKLQMNQQLFPEKQRSRKPKNKSKNAEAMNKNVEIVNNEQIKPPSDDYNDEDFTHKNLGYEGQIIQEMDNIQQMEDENIGFQYQKNPRNDMEFDIFEMMNVNSVNNIMEPQSQDQDVMAAFKVEYKIENQPQKVVDKQLFPNAKKHEKKSRKTNQNQVSQQRTNLKQKQSHEPKIKKQPKLPLPHHANKVQDANQASLPFVPSSQYKQAAPFPSVPSKQTYNKPVANQQPSSIIHPLHSHSYEQSIVVNNINTHPFMYPPAAPTVPTYFVNPSQNYDYYTENNEHPNSGATIALTSMSTAAGPKTTNSGAHNPITVPNPVSKGKKTKIKAKNPDQDYECESDDDYVIQTHRGKKRVDKKSKSRGHKDSSNSTQNNQAPRKRGRQPKRASFQAGVARQAAMLLGSQQILKKQTSSYHYPIVTRQMEQHQSQTVMKGLGNLQDIGQMLPEDRQASYANPQYKQQKQEQAQKEHEEVQNFKQFKDDPDPSAQVDPQNANQLI